LRTSSSYGADQRKELERLCRYITRPAIANERLKRNHAGQVVLQLKSAYKNGTTHVVMSPLEFMQRLAALVPRPRLHLIRFHGVLAPHAKLRAAIVPSAPENTIEHAADHAHHTPARLTWARLLKRVFDLDIERCSNCGGSLKIIAAIEARGASICSKRLDLPHQRVDLFQAACSTSPIAVSARRPRIALGLRSGKRPTPRQNQLSQAHERPEESRKRGVFIQLPTSWMAIDDRPAPR
jgi:hypothetical protein